ncbi:MAG: PEP-CTERM sorting domain-containing protein [Candidatus Pacebacteria bacterium]|nr:PEP-CTERM sorting domain-containing protein [Candidatus Paceibacterota bacterium]
MISSGNYYAKQTASSFYRQACVFFSLLAMLTIGWVLPAAADFAFMEDDFESYTSGARLPEVAPWTDVEPGNITYGRQLTVRSSNNVYPGDGSRTVPVSPYASGSQMLEFWDNGTTRAIHAKSTFSAPSGVHYPITVSLDYRIDEEWDTFAGGWRAVIEDSDGGSANGYYINLISGSDPDNLSLSYIDGLTQTHTLLTLDRGVWYHLDIILEQPDGTKSQPGGQIAVSRWDDGDANPTFVGTFDITSRAGFNEIDTLAFTWGSPAALGLWYLDNVHVVPEPASLFLLAVGGMLLLQRRKR